MNKEKSDGFILPETKLENITIAGHVLEVEMVRDLNKYLDEIADYANGNEDLIPYWSEFWPSSSALANYLVNIKNQLKGKKIIELGCGIGLIATILAIEGIDIMATDHQPLALDLTEKNVHRNSGNNITTRLLDWRFPDIDEKFDVIIASDIIYESRSIKPLMNIFLTLLKKRGSIYLAEPNRSVAKPFFYSLRERGFIFSNDDFFVKNEGREVRVSIYHIQ